MPQSGLKTEKKKKFQNTHDIVAPEHVQPGPPIREGKAFWGPWRHEVNNNSIVFLNKFITLSTNINILCIVALVECRERA